MTLVRGTLAVAAGILVFGFGAMSIDLAAQGFPLRDLWTVDIHSARNLNSLLSRNLNQLLGVVFTTVAIAVPLTANMYSVKFLEIFITDRVNVAVLVLAVVANLNNTIFGYGLRDAFVPAVHLHVTLALAVVCFAVLFPYLYYVFRFLHPVTLLRKLDEEIARSLTAAAGERRVGARRRQVAEAIEHVANIAIRSVDRLDRATAVECIEALEAVTRRYHAVKPSMPPKWFVAEAGIFPGFSRDAVAELSQSRTWLEMKIFSQMRDVLSAAVPKTHDVAGAVARTMRRLGSDLELRKDAALRELVMEYFNTFVRLALNRRDARSVFTILDQYRSFAESINTTNPELVLEIAYYFQYYGSAARDLQLPFLVEAGAHDLGVLVQSAWEAEAPNRDKLLERFLCYDAAAAAPLPGVKKAQAILASYFLMTGRDEPAETIRRSFEGLPASFVAAIMDDLLHIKRQKYWEVNERRMNIQYVPDQQRAHLRRFFSEMGMGSGLAIEHFDAVRERENG